MSQVLIKHHSDEYPITVQTFDHEVRASCDHAGAYTGMIEKFIEVDRTTWIEATVCNRCPAYKLLSDDDREEWNE